MTQLPTLVVLGKLYRNTKTQQLYRVLHVGTHTETGELMVHYQASSREGPAYGDSYFRPLPIFAGLRADGRPYFEPIEED